MKTIHSRKAAQSEFYLELVHLYLYLNILPPERQIPVKRQEWLFHCQFSNIGTRSQSFLGTQHRLPNQSLLHHPHWFFCLAYNLNLNRYCSDIFKVKYLAQAALVHVFSSNIVFKHIIQTSCSSILFKHLVQESCSVKPPCSLNSVQIQFKHLL